MLNSFFDPAQCWMAMPMGTHSTCVGASVSVFVASGSRWPTINRKPLNHKPQKTEGALTARAWGGVRNPIDPPNGTCMGTSSRNKSSNECSTKPSPGWGMGTHSACMGASVFITSEWRAATRNLKPQTMIPQIPEKAPHNHPTSKTDRYSSW